MVIRRGAVGEAAFLNQLRSAGQALAVERRRESTMVRGRYLLSRLAALPSHTELMTLINMSRDLTQRDVRRLVDHHQELRAMSFNLVRAHFIRHRPWDRDARPTPLGAPL